MRDKKYNIKLFKKPILFSKIQKKGRKGNINRNKTDNITKTTINLTTIELCIFFIYMGA